MTRVDDDVETPDVIRVDGGASCPTCGLAYREHPVDTNHLGYDGQPFLRVGCDGMGLKL